MFRMLKIVETLDISVGLLFEYAFLHSIIQEVLGIFPKRGGSVVHVFLGGDDLGFDDAVYPPGASPVKVGE